jgi:CBS domain-containing protein
LIALSRRAQGGDEREDLAMKVSAVLRANNQQLARCASEESISSIAKRLADLNIGALPVCGLQMRLIGIISERDLVRGLALHGVKLAEKRVRDLMTTQVATCLPESTMEEAEKLMHAARVRHLPVVEADNKIVGMLSMRDVFVWRIGQQRAEAEMLRDAMIAARHG